VPTCGAPWSSPGSCLRNDGSAMHHSPGSRTGDIEPDQRARSSCRCSALLQPDRRTPRRYNRRDTPTRLYRPLRMRDRMRSMSSLPAPERHIAGRDAKARVQAPSRPRSESRQRTALVAVRLLPAERDILAETARSRGITLSELIRASAMRAASAPATEAEARLPARPGPVAARQRRPPTLRSFIEGLQAGGRVITGYRYGRIAAWAPPPGHRHIS
jgi:hypothetical protein